ncbi:MAG TPA: ABC transporter permease [Dehalococcoidia bacterium]|nr:ABC transporter permease [Dehalococcoidia bacterium]
MTTLKLMLRQALYENRAFWRNPAAAFFTFIFPLMFLVIFNVVFGDNEIEVSGGRVDTSTFYVPAIIALSVINTCFTGMAQTVAFARDRGVLKRVRGAPLPPVAYLGGRITQSVWSMILLVTIVLGAGMVFYGVDVQTDKLPAAFAVLVIGAATFCALGLAITAIIPNADAAPAIVNATILPLLFISDVFIPTANSPHWITSLASVFPVSHMAGALHDAFNPYTPGSGLVAKDVIVLVAWGVAGAVIAARYFSWEPRR